MPVKARSFASFCASSGCCRAGGRCFGAAMVGFGRRDSWCSSTRARGARGTWEARVFSAFVGMVRAVLRLAGWKMLGFFLPQPDDSRGSGPPMFLPPRLRSRAAERCLEVGLAWAMRWLLFWGMIWGVRRARLSFMPSMAFFIISASASRDRSVCSRRSQ